MIARHYLDALQAVPDDGDTREIRQQAVGALIRAAERAERTGAPALATTSYATAAELTLPSAADGQPTAGMLWERAAQAAVTDASWAVAVEHAGRARGYYLDHGQARAAARAQATAGTALRWRGRYAEARQHLTAAVQILREDPDTDTVRALRQLAALEVFAGAPDADRLTLEVLILGQALGVGTSELVEPFTTRGIYLAAAERRPEALAYYGEAARLATQVCDNIGLGRVLGNMADVLAATDPAAAAEAARAAAGHLRRAGARKELAVAIINLVEALLQLGDWDAAEKELTQGVGSDVLADNEDLACYRGWLAALRGDTATAQTMLAALPDLRASEDPQDKATSAPWKASPPPPAASRRTRCATRAAHSLRPTLVGISIDCLRWAWPLAARTPIRPATIPSPTGELLTLLDALPARAPGPHVAGRTRPGPRPPGRPRRRPGCGRILRSRHHRPARAEYPLPPRPWPARPRPASHALA